MSVKGFVSYDLDEGMLDLLGKEFNVEEAALRFARAVAGKTPAGVEELGQTFFAQFGKEWMNRTIDLGEKHTDKVYETMKAAIAKTGESAFPHVPQRFIEIAYLAIQPLAGLPVLETNRHRLAYRVPNCTLYAALQKACGSDIAALLPCRSACLAACNTVSDYLHLSLDVQMRSTMPANGSCEFVLSERR